MSESTFSRILAKFNVLAAREQGLEEELEIDTWQTHGKSSTDKKGSPIKVMRPSTRRIMHKNLNGIEPVYKSPPISGGQGFFEARKGGKKGSAPAMQGLAEETSAIIADDRRFHSKEEKRKRVLQEIEDEFRARNPEFYQDDEL